MARTKVHKTFIGKKGWHLLINNVAQGTTKDQLKRHFGDRLSAVTIPNNSNSDSRLNYALCKFLGSGSEDLDAVKQLDGSVLNGSRISVKFTDRKAYRSASATEQETLSSEIRNAELSTANELSTSYTTRSGKSYIRNIDEDGYQTPNKAHARTLQISNLSHSTSKADLKAVFIDYAVSHVLIPTLPQKVFSSKNGFVNMESISEARHAIDALDGSMLKGRRISIKIADDGPPEKRDSNGLRHGGVDIRQEHEPPYRESHHDAAQPSKKRRRVSNDSDFIPLNATSENYDHNDAMVTQNNQRTGYRFNIPVQFIPAATADSYQNIQETNATFGTGSLETDYRSTGLQINGKRPLESCSDPSVGSPPKKYTRSYQDLPERSAPQMAGSYDYYDYGALARAASSNVNTSYEGDTSGIKLRELSPDGQVLQARYFHITNPSSAVRCLSCGTAGHAEDSCPQSQCQHCSSKGDHFSFACPKFQKCRRCRQRGHASEQCTGRAVFGGGSDDPCDVCNFVGHVEEECPYLCRTAYPDESIVRKIQARDMAVGCYTCGSNQHWGDDCPELSILVKSMRNKGVPGTWSAAHAVMFVEGGHDVGWVKQGRSAQLAGSKAVVTSVADDDAPRLARGSNYQLALLDDMRD